MNEMSRQPSGDPRKSLSIKGLMPGLTERGKIKIGIKGRTVTSRQGKEFHPPEKLDHFVVTTLQRGPDGNFIRDEEVHRVIGDHPVEIPVRLLYNDPELNFQSRYVLFSGRTMACSGDGEQALRMRKGSSERDLVQCPCHLADPANEGPHKCKMNGTLSVIIDGVGVVGGVWKLRTTSFNSIVGIMSSLHLIKSLTGGPLAGIPLHLTLAPKTGVTPQGQAVSIYVVGLEFRGTPDHLQRIGYERALQNAQHYARIEMIEDKARGMLRAMPAPELDGTDPDDVVEEFYPEQAAADIAIDPPTSPPTAVPPAPPASASGDGDVPLAQPKANRRRKIREHPEEGGAPRPEPSPAPAAAPAPEPASALSPPAAPDGGDEDLTAIPPWLDRRTDRPGSSPSAPPPAAAGGDEEPDYF